MKILFLISSLRGGGAERVASTLCNYWAENKHDVTLVTLDGKQNDFFVSHPRLKRYDLDSYTSSKNMFDKIKANLSRLVRIRRIIKNNKPDVVLAFMDVSNVLATVACLGTGIPVVISERSYPPYFHDGDWFDRIRRMVYQYSSAFVAQTNKIADWGREFLAHKPIAVIVNPLADKALNSNLNTDRKNVILGMGRLHPDKGFDLLIEAFNLCYEHYPEWELHIAGIGREQPKLENMIQTLGLGDRVRLLGETDQPQALYAQAKIYVLSSRVEGFPNVLIEAMANGLPVTSFDCNSGPADIIENEINGLLVPPMQVDALALSMQRLMADENLRTNLGREAAKIRSKYILENISEQWLNLFRQVSRKHAASV